ncbi:MAG: aldehyde dehydrogenase family protein [Deltaproteobacteria bacterium]|nr:aldehyde dehydrogenase family protein [Deltaproteobacteria bacterium]
MSPTTGMQIGTSPTDSVGDVFDAVKRSRAAQAAWAELPVKERARAIFRIRDYIVSNADALADTISQDNGKTRIDAMGTELLPAAMAAHYYAKHAKRFLSDKRLRPGNLLLANKISKITRVPLGVVGVISPWNYPFAIPFSEIVMALLAGNGVILKVATETQLVGRALERCIQAGELPEGLFAHLNVPGRLAGGAFLEAGIDKLFFTGSVPVGKKLMAKAAETLTPVSLELGGNDAMLVCADADLDRAVGGAVWAGLQNCGQSCGGVERIYVHASISDAFMEKLKTRVEALRVGPDVDHRCDLGAMTTTRQMVLVREHVADALDRGAAIFAQTSVPEGDTGNFLPAMVLTNVDHSMRVMREETFGPLLGVMKVATMDEAVSFANDSDLGLTASVWGQDRKSAEVLARQLRAGSVTINDHLMSHGLAETPWGGFKESGIGRTHGALGFDEMTQPQCIVHDYLPGVRRNMWWHPFSARVYEGLRGILDLLYGRGVGQRLEGARQLARLFPRTFNLKDDSDDA